MILYLCMKILLQNMEIKYTFQLKQFNSNSANANNLPIYKNNYRVTNYQLDTTKNF